MSERLYPGLIVTYNDQSLLNSYQVAIRLGVARSTIYRWLEEGRFPHPIRLSDNSSRWRVIDIERWINRRAMETATQLLHDTDKPDWSVLPSIDPHGLGLDSVNEDKKATEI